MPSRSEPLPAPKLGEPYLLTPGPLTTAYEVKEAMLRDWGSWDADFRAMGFVSKLAELAVAGRLDAARVARTLKARHRHVPYLRALLARTLADDRPYLTAMLCRAVLDWQPIPRFRHHLGIAEHRLAERGGTLPGRARERADS